MDKFYNELGTVSKTEAKTTAYYASNDCLTAGF